MIPAWVAVAALLVGVVAGLLVKRQACYDSGVLAGQQQAELAHGRRRPAVSGEALGAFTDRPAVADAWSDRNRQDAPRIVGYRRPTS